MVGEKNTTLVEKLKDMFHRLSSGYQNPSGTDDGLLLEQVDAIIWAGDDFREAYNNWRDTLYEERKCRLRLCEKIENLLVALENPSKAVML